MNFIQKGGIIIQSIYNSDTAANFFIQNSTCDIISYKTKGGIIFKLTLNPGIKSPYSVSRSIGTNITINQIILKLVFLHESAGFRMASDVKYNQQSTDNFTDELNIQKDVYEKSFGEDLEPICPSIAFSQIIDTDSKLFLSNLFNIASTLVCEKIINRLIQKIPGFKIGLIMMELLDGFDNLTGFIQESQLKKKREPSNLTQQLYLDLALFELYLLYNIGYIHGDLTLANLMLNRDYQYLDRQHPGRVIIIDFGVTFLHGLPEKILPDNIARVAELCRTIGSPFYGKIADEQARTWPSYDWLDYYITNKDASNIRLKEIYDMRQEQKYRFHESILLNERNYLKKGETILGVKKHPHISTISDMNVYTGDDSAAVAVIKPQLPYTWNPQFLQPHSKKDTDDATEFLKLSSFSKPSYGTPSPFGQSSTIGQHSSFVHPFFDQSSLSVGSVGVFKPDPKNTTVIPGGSIKKSKRKTKKRKQPKRRISRNYLTK
jgi:hypothetical protein